MADVAPVSPELMQLLESLKPLIRESIEQELAKLIPAPQVAEAVVGGKKLKPEVRAAYQKFLREQSAAKTSSGNRLRQPRRLEIQPTAAGRERLQQFHDDQEWERIRQRGLPAHYAKAARKICDLAVSQGRYVKWDSALREAYENGTGLDRLEDRPLPAGAIANRAAFAAAMARE